MSGKHSADTKLLGFYASNDLADRVDRARSATGLTRSQFLREAVVAHVLAKGIDIPERMRFAPDQAGKGGRKRKQANDPMPNVRGDHKILDSETQAKTRNKQPVTDPPVWANGGIDPKTGELSSEVNAAVLGLVKKAADEAANNPPVVFGRKRRAG